MNAAEAAAAMKLLSGLALTFLEGFNTSLEDERKRIGDAHFASACRLIEAQRGDAGLTADTIAQAIGCSRASLYRLFEQRGLSVAEHIRAVRLNHGRALLRDPRLGIGDRSEAHTSELQSLMRISYAVFCLKKKKTQHKHT